MHPSIICAALIVLYGIMDALYVVYTIATTRRRPIAAASAGAGIHLIMAFGIIQYTQQPWYIVPIALGSWLGTYLAIKFYSGVPPNDNRK